ncbi:DALR anticodon-binding domain-containing protein, partial [Sphingomonas sp.]|uniref:DALR anticodon-binding domain-containing protein n=1 Tax=Sphingomonas sp. TaxID=28214 RepID=UPI002DB8CEE9
QLRFDLKRVFVEGVNNYARAKFSRAEVHRISDLVDTVVGFGESQASAGALELATSLWDDPSRRSEISRREFSEPGIKAWIHLHDFFADRLKVQQREAGVRHDLIDAVFALGGEDDLVRLLARVRALQAFVERQEGADLLAGYKRAANILKKEGWASAPAKAGAQEGAVQGDSGLLLSQEHEGEVQGIPQTGEEDPFVMAEDLRDAIMGHEKTLSYTPAPEESSLIAALDSAEPRARTAVAAEDFEGAMAALATLRAPVDAFFEKVTVNDPDPAKRAARLNLLARMRDAVHQVADFSRIEG